MAWRSEGGRGNNRRLEGRREMGLKRGGGGKSRGRIASVEEQKIDSD